MSSLQNNMDSFVLIGLGNMGQKHLKHLLDEWPASKIYVYEAIRSQSNICSTMNVQFIQNFKELKRISESETNFIIASSTKTHLDYLNMLIGSGKRILIEKPMGGDDKLLIPVLLHAIKVGCKITPGFLERYSLASFLLDEFVKSMKINKILITRESAGWPKDIDVVLDLMIHDLDLLIFKGFPLSVKKKPVLLSADNLARSIKVFVSSCDYNSEEFEIEIKASHKGKKFKKPARKMSLLFSDGSFVEIDCLRNCCTGTNEILKQINNKLRNSSTLEKNGSRLHVDWGDKILAEQQSVFNSGFNFSSATIELRRNRDLFSIIQKLREYVN